MGIDRHGDLLIQEDPGGDPHLARRVGLHTDDEESSGIIDARRHLGRGWFLFDAQVHEDSGDPATVELGQLLALHVRDFDAVYDAG